MTTQSGIEQANDRIREAAATKALDLYLSYLDLSTIPEDVVTLTQLETLVLTGNQIKHLPPEIGQLTKLRVLDLSGNQLTGLPEELCYLPELRQLEVAANQLQTLPKAIGQLGNLQTLDIYGNQLKALPDSIHFCHNLSSLRANENSLSSLPEMIGDLTSLVTLDLSYNEIQELPLSFFNLTQLKELYLTGNELEVPFDILSRHSNQPEKLLENIRNYEKHLSEKLAKQQKKNQLAKIKALTEHQLAESIVIKMSHYKSSLNGIRFHYAWPEKNNLHAIARRLLAFDQRMGDICCLWFCLNETMTSGKMDKIIRSLDLPPTLETTRKSTFVPNLRAIAKDNDVIHDVQIKQISHDQTLKIEALFPSTNECERYLTLWLVLTELLSENEFNLDEKSLPIITATLSHVITSYLHKHEHASRLANGLLRLLLDETLP